MRGQPLHVQKGEVIIGNDMMPDGVYFLDTGYVKIYSISDEGHEYLHIIYGHGDLFPLTWAYMDSQPSQLYYETISDCTLWRVSRYWFTQMARTNAAISYDLGLQLAYQFRVYSDRIDNLEYKKASDRVIYRLLFLGSRFGTKQDDSLTIDAPITHEHFANSINLARESVSRELEKLEREGLLYRSDNRLVLTDAPALAARLSKPIDHRDWSLL